LTIADLVALADSLDFDALDQAWSEAKASPGSIGEYQKTLEVLCDQDAVGTALGLGATMVDALAEKGRGAEAIELAQILIDRGAHNEALTKRLHEVLRTEYGGEDWFPLLADKARLSESSLDPDSLGQMIHLLGYTPGHVVYHRSGWGEGTVEGFDVESGEVTVRFATGRVQDFPFTTVLDSFKPLPKGDLRAMRLQQPDELERLANDDPSALIRLAANLYRGRINSTEVKKELSPSVIPTKKWAAFWKRAKAAAAHDPWLLVEGSTTRPIFIMRKKPVGLVDEAQYSVDHADNLGQAMGILRDYLERTTDAEMRTQLLDLAAAKIEAALQSDKAKHAHRLDGILMLEEHGRESSVPAAKELRDLLLTDGQFVPDRFEELATDDARAAAVRILPEALGEEWAKNCIETVGELPASVAEQIVDLLVEHGHAASLLQCWDKIAPYPRRHPILTYLMCRHYADGTFDGLEGVPSVVTVARVGLHLARVLTEEKTGNPLYARLLTRSAALLTGRRALLARALDGISRDDLATYLGISERAAAGTNEFPSEITAVILRAVSDKYPDLTSRPDKPFWELDAVFVTAAGLARQREEYRVLVDEKIPENSEAIGAAASLGDLSENSEWESAMEEQRNLTSRAQQMDAALRTAKLIEHQEIPEGVVAPGMRVRLRQADGTTQEHTILGPWDCVEDGIINYKAPLAQAMLGKKVGDTVDLPGSQSEATIDAIDSVL